LEPRAKHTDGNGSPADHLAGKNSDHARKSPPEAAKDMRRLVVRLDSAKNVAGLEERKPTARVFGERRVAREPASGSDLEPTVAVKDPREVGRDDARRPSDPDAGCSGHKGKGRQARICETSDPDADPNDKPLNLAAHVNPRKPRGGIATRRSLSP
jgi:hypothetical protein